MMSSQQDNGGFPPNPFQATDTSNNTDFFETNVAPAPQQNMSMDFQPQQQQQQQQQQSNLSGALQPQQPPPLQQQQQQQQAPTTWWGTITSCLNLRAHAKYFDVDTADIHKRIKGAVVDCYVPDKFRNDINSDGRGPDLYGPFWITMTLVFLVAVSSNAAIYTNAVTDDELDYDITHLLRALTVLSSFVVGLPLLIWVLMKCLGLSGLSAVELICLYGYSLVPLMPTTLICLIPVDFLVWIALTVAVVASGVLILRNVAGVLLNSDNSSTQQKAGPLLIFMMACQVIFLAVLKLVFY